jgi:mono/diheme cytochrome c family protein
MVVAALGAPAQAAAARPAVYVVPPGTIERFATTDAAVGLYVPGAGGKISRAGAIASLRRGKVQNTLLGGVPEGDLLVDLVTGTPDAAAAAPTVLVELPPPGTHSNTKRYWVAIRGAGYRGILVSDATRIRGLVPIAEIAPAVVALQQGRSPPIRSEPSDDAVAELRELERRLSAIHRDRGWTLAAVVFTILGLVVLWPRAAVLGGAAAITASLLLSCSGATELWVLIPGMVALTAGLACVGAARRSLIPLVVTGFFAGYLAVLVISPETNALAVLGARPDGGGRFYGVTNQVETLLLAPLLAAAAIGGRRWLVPLGVLALVTVGWSNAGADGGGVAVYATALAVVGLRQSSARVTWRRALVAAGAVVAVALVAVGLDAAFGGSSHVTRAFGSGPDSLLGDLGQRLHLSWELLTKDLHNIVLFVGCGSALVWMATRRRRGATVDAMLIALVVSLLVNDTPVDVVGLGALGCLALFRWESVDSRPMRRGAMTAVSLLAVLALTACGEEGVVAPTAETVVGTVAQAAPGKSVFLTQQCGSCHLFTPAGSAAKGTIGPDLDKLAEYANRANQPLAEFTRESIVSPDAYIEKGYPKGVMPKSYGDLPPDDLDALVVFLAKPQG